MRRPEGKIQESLKLGRKEIGAIAAGVLVLLVIGVAIKRCRHGSVGWGWIGSADEEEASVEAGADWCAPGLEPLGDACFAAAAGESHALVVYLHGRYTPETQTEETERQARVARMATARGFSVIAFRGRIGGCLGPELAEYWCWPSNELTQGGGADTVASWSASLDAAEKRIGRVPRYLLGFSNGAYFAALIATRALMPLDAIAIVSGGPVEPTKAVGAKTPILLITADDDGAQDEILRLESELIRESWPNALVSREGGHALTDFDVDMALKFFERTQKEKLPFAIPLSTRRPIRPVDAADTDVAQPPADADDELNDPTNDDP